MSYFYDGSIARLAAIGLMSARSKRDDAVDLAEQTGHFRWRRPRSVHAGQVFVDDPTGRRAALSDEDGDLVLENLCEQFAHRWYAYALRRFDGTC